MPRNELKNAACLLTRVSGCNLLLRWLTKGDARIVTYHGVQDGVDPVVNFDGLQVPESLFRKQMEVIGRHFRVVPLAEVVDAIRERRPPRPRSLVITFDDGYLNNMDVAAPILRSYGFTASFFVTTGFVRGVHRPWWYDLRSALARTKAPSLSWPDGRRWELGTPAERGKAARALEAELLPMPAAARAGRLDPLFRGLSHDRAGLPFKFMSEPDIKRLSSEGFDVGAHTASHVSLSAETEELCQSEIRDSVNDLNSWTGRAIRHFAYPYGQVPPDRAGIASALGRCGLVAAVTTSTGFNDEHTPPYFLYRHDINGGRTAANLDAMLAGSLAFFRA